MSEQIQQMQQLQLAGTLAGGIAHDLNNQLTLVLGNLEMAMDRVPDGDAYDSLELAKTAAGRCAEMSRRLLYLGRNNPVVMTRIDLASAVLEAQLMLECIKPPNIKMAVEAEPGLYIQGDATQIQQVLINLGTNAFHAMTRGGEMRVQAYHEGDRVSVMVRDTGCGIPKSIRQQIFEPFYTTRAESGGSGLGLTTVRSIVDAHGGLIGMETAIGKGTTFLMSFPALPPEIEEGS